jgi:hypothetical protein
LLRFVKQILSVQTLISILGLIFIAKASHHFWLTALYGFGHGDGGGYYMPIAERILNGDMPFRDFQGGYCPLGMVIMAGFQYLLRPLISDPVTIHYLCIYTAQLICCTLMVNILKNFKVQIPIIIVTIGVYLQLLISFLGADIFLEHFVVLFSMALLRMIIDEKRPSFLMALACGVMTACCALSKQYGLVMFPAGFICLILKECPLPDKIHMKRWILLIVTGILLLRYNIGVNQLLLFTPCLLVILIISEARLKIFCVKTASIFLAYTFGFILTFILFLSCFNISWVDFLDQIFGSGYYKNVIVSSSKIYGFMRSYHLLFFIIAFALFKTRFRFGAEKMILIFFTAFFPCFLVRQFDHYFLMIIPFFALWLGISCKQISKHFSWGHLTLLLLLSLSYPALTQSQWHHVDIHGRQTMRQKALELNQIYSRGSSVFLLSFQNMYYYAGWIPTFEKLSGYGFVSNFHADNILDRCHQSDRVVIDVNGLNFNHHRKDSKLMGRIHRVLNEKFIKVKTTSFDAECWNRSSPSD